MTQNKQFQRASEIIEKMPLSSARTSAINNVGFQLGYADGVAAGKWALQFQNLNERKAAMRSIISGMSQAGALPAMQQVRAVVPPEWQAQLDQEIGRLAGTKGVAAVQELESSGSSDSTLAGAVNSMPVAELAELTPKLLAMENKQARAQAIVTTGSRMVEFGPERAVQWLQTLPEEVKSAAIIGLVHGWYTVDEQSLPTRISSLPLASDQDRARESWAGKKRLRLDDTIMTSNSALIASLESVTRTFPSTYDFRGAMKTITVTSIALAAIMSFATAQDKSLGEKTSDALQKTGEKVKETGRAVADSTKKAADTVVDAVTPDKDARKVDVKLVDHRIEMPNQVGTGKTAFVVHNAGKQKHNFQIAGAGFDKKFMLNLAPDETKVLNVDLQPGTYKVTCPVGDHEEEGMKLNLTVK